MSKILLLPFLFAFTVASSQSVTLYEDCTYTGKQYQLEPGNYRLSQMKVGNDRLSSLAIPNGMKVTVYENDNYSGKSKTYTANVPCMEAEWNDMASSIVVENSYYNQYNQNDYVVFYNDCNSKGYSQTLRPGRYKGSDLGNLKYNISSFAIYGNLTVKAYINNENLSGYSVTHTANETCLSSSENDKIGSIVIQRSTNNNNNNNNGNNGGYNGGYNNGNNGGYNNGNSNSYATIYTDCNYRGNSLRLSPGTYQGDKLGLFKYDISSIEMPSNLQAKVYINNEYLGGTYYTLSENTSCLSSNLNNRIGSLVIEEVNYNNNNYPNNNNNNNESVIIYTDTDYKGQAAYLLPGSYSTMAQVNFPDKALSSLVVPAGYRVVIYEQQNFGGKSYTITDSKTKFYLSGWNDKTSSIVVYRD